MPTDFKLPNGRYVVSQRWTLLAGKDWLLFVLQTLRILGASKKNAPAGGGFPPVFSGSLEQQPAEQVGRKHAAPLSCATWNFLFFD